MSNWDADPFAGQGASGAPNPNGHTTWRELEFIRARNMRPQLESATLIKGLIDAEQLSLLFGNRGCGKTFLAIDRDLCIATGLPWFGRRVRQGPVVYLAIEAGRRIIQNRASAWLQAHDMVGQDVPFVAITTPVDLCHLKEGDVPLLISTIQQRIGFAQIALLEIDTISRALAGGDENAPQDMGALVHALDLLRSGLRCHVSGIHHVGKTEGKGSRGHSLLPAAVDTEIEVTRPDGTATSSFTIKRQRDGIAGEKHYFGLPVLELGRDPEDGDIVTSCTVEPVEPPNGAAAETTSAVKLNDPDRIAFAQLHNAVCTAGTAPPASNHIPVGATCVPLDLWRRYAYEGGISGSDKPDTQLKAFNRSAQRLVAVGLVGRHNNLVWTP